jgi:hypothetical protein
MTGGRKMEVRIAVTPETKERIRLFAEGMGVTYDAAMSFLLDCAIQGDETEMQAGHRLRVKLKPELKHGN